MKRYYENWHKFIVETNDNNTTPERQLVDNIASIGHPHPFLRNTIVFAFKGEPQPIVTIELVAMSDSVYLTGLLSTNQKKGYGRYVMGLVIEEADKLNVVLTGVAEPFGAKDVRISKSKLVKFYKSLGFKVDSNGRMKKMPNEV